MTIDKNLDGTKLEIALEGRLDTMTAPQLEEEVKSNIEGIKELIFDLKNLAYVSSAGLRVLLSAQKIMNIILEVEVLIETFCIHIMILRNYIPSRIIIGRVNYLMIPNYLIIHRYVLSYLLRMDFPSALQRIT